MHQVLDPLLNTPKCQESFDSQPGMHRRPTTPPRIAVLFSRLALAVLLLLPFFAAAAYPQTAQAPGKGKSVEGLGLQVQDKPTTGQEQKPAQTISPEEAKELFRSVDEILKFSSEETGLPINEEVKRRLVGRDEVQSFIQKGMKDDKDAKRLERSEVVLKKFGLLPRDFDLKSFLVTLLREQVAGYYDPKTKTVNLLNWVDPGQQKPVLAHELTHALQDQSFGLEKWMKPSTQAANDKADPSPADIGNDEDLAARQAIVEGQAMAVLLDYSLAPTGKSVLTAPEIVEALKQGMLTGTPDSPAFRDAPIFLKETLTFSYRYGLDFTVALLRSGGKALAYAGAFKVPPTTTREIMEPETYLEREKIEPLKLLNFDKDFKEYDWFDIGAIGEFDVDVLVEQYAGTDEAQVLYPQWRGGYYFAGRPKGHKSAPLCLVYVSRWSTPEKAAEFAAVYARSLEQRYKHPQALGPDGKIEKDAPPVSAWHTLSGYHAWMTDEGPVVIEVRGAELLISESMDAATTKQVEGDFWAGAKDSSKK